MQDGVEKIEGRYYITYNGIKGDILYWSNKYNIPYRTIYKRIYSRKSIEEILSKEKLKVTYQKKKKRNSISTICWNCKNSVPTKDMKIGCVWSIFQKPIDGWKSVKTTVNHQESFLVLDCPEFLEG